MTSAVGLPEMVPNRALESIATLATPPVRRPAMAADVIAVIEPSYVVPMHYAQPGLKVDLEPVDKFLKAVGVTKATEDDMLRVTAGNLPEQPQVVLLTPAQE